MKQQDNPVHVWRVPNFNQLELLRARYSAQWFTPHMHDQFALGVIEAGALEFDYRGETLVAPTGSVNLCIPGEMHTGHAAGSEGWAYRMLYFDPALLQQIACEIGDHPADMPFIQSGVLYDEVLAGQIRRLHTLFEEDNLPTLAREQTLDQVITRLILHHAQRSPEVRPFHQETTAVERVRAYLEAFYAEDVSYADLCRVASLSRFHLNRVFHQATGVPPYAYLRQVRIRQAKELLAQGESIAEAAFHTGFSDQSHLQRWFKRQYGFTPGEYSNSVQYA